MQFASTCFKTTRQVGLVTQIYVSLCIVVYLVMNDNENSCKQLRNDNKNSCKQLVVITFQEIIHVNDVFLVIYLFLYILQKCRA